MGYIQLGRYNKYYKYIIFQVICNFLYQCTFGLSYGSEYTPISFFEKQYNFSSHYIINNIFYYFGTFFFSLILYKFDPNTKQKNKSNESDNISTIKLIRYKNKNIKKEYYIIILISFLWVIHEQLILIYYVYFYFNYLDYWTLEILITYYISKKMFNIEIYKHQQFAIFFNSVLCSLFLVFPFIMSVISKKENILKDQPVLIPIGVIFFLIIIFIRSYTNCKIKWISDLKDISVYKILIFYGMIGAIICSIISLITTFIECNFEKYIICPSKVDNKKYLDSFIGYYKDFSSSKIIFIVLTFFSIIFGFLKSFFYIIIVKYLTPIHAIALPTILYFLTVIILGIYSLIKTIDDERDMNEIEIISNFCDIIAYFLAILGIFIYSELIELNFCKLNYNIRSNIIKRGNIDLYLGNDFKEGIGGQILPDDEDDNEDEDEENERKNELSEINKNNK
jgi:hypothetical protein